MKKNPLWLFRALEQYMYFYNEQKCLCIDSVKYFTPWAQVTQTSCLNELNVILPELISKVYQLRYCGFSEFYQKKFLH